MRLANFQIKNYKSFDATERLPLNPGFNVVVGPNNSGKTALLECLTMRFSWNAHRSSKSIPKPTTQKNPTSRVDVSLVATGEEILETMLASGNQFLLPQPNQFTADVIGGTHFIEYIVKQPEVTLRLAYSANSQAQASVIVQTSPVATFYDTTGMRAQQFYVFDPDVDRSRMVCRSVVSGGNSDSFLQIGQLLLAQIYYFRAERLNISEFSFGANSILASDASNLPEVLHLLQTNKPLQFQRFVNSVKEVFPGVEYLSVRPKSSGGNVQEIVVWTETQAHSRADLAFTLKESGTGLGQVLAILYVVLNSDQSQCILIDEPNSFLHPAASRKLIQIIGEFPQHQYIISTHSPEVIRAAHSTNVMLLQRTSQKATISLLDAAQLESHEKYMHAVGVRLSDVFGADNIVWVEGLTEEAFFPKLITPETHKHPHDITTILAVKNTGDFHGKKLKRLRLILDLYRKVSESGALIPPTLGFIFDSEGLSEEDKSSLRTESRGLIRFLPRRMIENYLLVPSVISDFFNSLDVFKQAPVKMEDIKSWFETNGADNRYFSPLPVVSKVFTQPWLKTVNGADLLDSLLAESSNQKERYDKLRHGLPICTILLEKGHQEFDEIRELLRLVIAGEL